MKEVLTKNNKTNRSKTKEINSVIFLFSLLTHVVISLATLAFVPS